jgi:hypothetical protein
MPAAKYLSSAEPRFSKGKTTIMLGLAEVAAAVVVAGWLVILRSRVISHAVPSTIARAAIHAHAGRPVRRPGVVPMASSFSRCGCEVTSVRKVSRSFFSPRAVS